MLEGADLVTTSAFLDLVSEDWASRLVDVLADRRTPFYAALSYDGRVEPEPAHPLDAAVTDLVNRHQRMDKGFGPALGPDAAERVGELLEKAGFYVTSARSDWICLPDEPMFQRELVDGWARAAEETGGLSGPDLRTWKDFRFDAIATGTSRIRVGHVDLLAVPKDGNRRGVHVAVF